MQTLHWTLCIHSFPRLARHCTRCGGSFYETGGRFRVNANGKRLDIWLVCRCETCKTVWNLPVLARVDRAALDPHDYERYLNNDPALALQYLFHPAFLSENHTALDPDTLEFALLGELPAEDQAVKIEVSCAYSVPLSADRIVARCLDLPRSRVKRLAAHGLLTFEEDTRRSKAGTDFAFSLAPGWRSAIKRS